MKLFNLFSMIIEQIKMVNAIKKAKIIDNDINDDGMYFIKGKFYTDKKVVSDDYTAYSFFPGYGEESENDFYFLAKYIMENVLQPYYTIISMRTSIFKDAYNFKKNHMRKEDQPFTTWYYKFLYERNMIQNVFIEDFERLIFWGNGLNELAIKLITENDDINALNDYCEYDIYAYINKPFIETFSDVKQYMESTTYDIYIECGKFPDYLEFTINNNTVDVNDIIKFAKEACEKYGRKFLLR